MTGLADLLSAALAGALVAGVMFIVLLPIVWLALWLLSMLDRWDGWRS